ncbi:MAG: outer membrane beta-barrel protein [Ignavibacteria bacterium]|jgi:hypothetical protein
MKKIIAPFLILFIILGISNTEAQSFAHKGTIELGGTIGFESETDVYDGETDDESLTTFSFSPLFGYFIINGLELGLTPIYEITSYGDNSDTMFGIFFAPQYHFDLQSNVYPYVGGIFGYNSFNRDRLNSDDTFSGISYGGMAGIKIQIGNSSLINLRIRYLIATFNPEDWTGDRNGHNNLAIEAGFSIFLEN